MICYDDWYQFSEIGLIVFVLPCTIYRPFESHRFRIAANTRYARLWFASLCSIISVLFKHHEMYNALRVSFYWFGPTGGVRGAQFQHSIECILGVKFRTSSELMSPFWKL